MSNTTFPSTVKDLTNFQDIRYLEGMPREYRFDAKSGVMKRGKENAITEKGEFFTFIPLAYRIFKAEMFAYEEKEWLEIYFIDANGNLSVMMFHGFSVESFRNCAADLFYEDRNVNESIVKVTPAPKSNEHGTYYVAEFSATPLPEKEVRQLLAFSNSLPEMYQLKTTNSGNGNDTTFNYGLPAQSVDGELPETTE